MPAVFFRCYPGGKKKKKELEKQKDISFGEAGVLEHKLAVYDLLL